MKRIATAFSFIAAVSVARAEVPVAYYDCLKSTQGCATWTRLDFCPRGDSVVDMKVNVFNGWQSGYLLSAWGTNSTDRAFSLLYSAWSKFTFYYGDKNWGASLGTGDFTFRLSPNGVWSNGTRVSTYNVFPKDFAAANPLVLFAYYPPISEGEPTANGSYGNVCLYSMQCYNDNGETLFADLYPCKDSDGNYGLYDIVSRKIYRNLGVGGSGKEFTVGSVAAGPTNSIVVLSKDGRRYGTVEPAYGTTNAPTAGATQFICKSPQIEHPTDAGVSVRCTGWKLYSVIDNSLIKSSADAGASATSFTHDYETGHGVIVEWEWTKAYRFRVAATSGGSVASDATTNLYESAASVTVTATPASGYRFVGWRGAAEGDRTTNPLSVTVGTSAVDLTAVFEQETPGEQTAVYAAADALPGGDGTSWARAYADIYTAVTNANALGLPLHIAKGLYILPGVLSVTNIPSIYGGFTGTNDAETVETRSIDVNKTVFVGDKTLNNHWIHVVPGAVGSYTYTATDLYDKPLFNKGELQMPPAFAGEYDTYLPNLDTSDRSAALSIKNAISGGVVDGLWFAGFCGANNAIVTYESGTKSMNLVNCRFVGNRPHRGSVKNGDTSSSKKVLGCKFMYSGVRISNSWGDASICGIDMGSGYSSNMRVSDCEFLSLPALGGNSMYTQWSGNNCLTFSQTYHYQFPCAFTVSGCSFVRDYAYQPDDRATGNTFCCGGQHAVRFVDCVYSNCLDVIADAGGRLAASFGRMAAEMIGCTFYRNRREQVAGANRTLSMMGGYSYGQRQFYNACSFVGNEFRVTGSTATNGTVIAALVMPLDCGAPQSGFSNCCFDNNVVTCPVKDGVTAYLCRGVVAYNATANQAGQGAICGCTFLGPKVEGVCDVLQYDANYCQAFNIVDSIFEYTGGEPYDGLVFLKPANVSLYSCTLANRVLPSDEYAVVDHDYDFVPFETNYVGATLRPVLVPAAKTPKIRQSADFVYNGATFSQPDWMTNYAFRAYGDSAWQPLSPASKKLDSDVAKNTSKYLCQDAAFVTRPLDGVTRGASQALTDTAENGATLTLRRKPFDSGSFEGPQVQSVAAGGSTVTVKAVPTDPTAMAFDGWYTEEGVKYSSSATLNIDALDASLVLEARFTVPKTDITFDLGEHGTFTENGQHTIVVSEVPGEAFPSVPEYAIDEGWLFAEWRPEFPQTTPSAATTYTAKVVTAEPRRIYVDKDSAAVDPDGLTWETAYPTVAEGYADVAVGQGELWIKEGFYKISDSIILSSNVVVRGGFAGDETSAAEADPKEHPTIISGDVWGDDVWVPQSKRESTAYGLTFEKIWNGETFLYPNPDFVTDKFWACSDTSRAGADNDTKYAFKVSGNAVENVGFHGMTFTCFHTAAIADAIGGESTMVISNCQFLANNGTYVQWNAAVNLSNRSLDMDDCRFVGNGGCMRLSGGASTSSVSNCVFDANVTLKSYMASGIYAYGANADIGNCTFSRGYSNQNIYEPVVCSLWVENDSGKSVTVADCRFLTNRVACLSKADVYKTGAGTLTLTRNRFEDIRIVDVGVNQWDSTIFANVFQTVGGVLTVRDSYFRACVGTRVAHVVGAILTSSGGTSQFVNDTFDDCAATSDGNAAVGLFGLHGSSGKIGVVSCLFNGTSITGSKTGFVASYGDTSSSSFSVINTAIVGSSNDFDVAYLANSAACLGFANDVIDNFDAAAIPTGSNGYVYDVTTNTPVSVGELKKGANGAWARTLVTEKRGRRVWEKDGTVYFRDEVANPAKPWRKAADNAFYAASVEGLPAREKLLPDAFGLPRPLAKRAFFGPVSERRGLLLIVR